MAGGYPNKRMITSRRGHNRQSICQTLTHCTEEIDMTEPDPKAQEDFTPQENHMVETQAMNPAVTNEKGERQDEGDPGAAEDSK